MTIRPKIARPRLAALAGALTVSVVSGPALSQSVPAHPHHARRLHRHVAAAPPAPPATPAPQEASAMAPAPVPNEGATPPLNHKTPSANVAPSVFQLHYPPQGEGYVTGSSPQAMDDRNAAKATGVQATIPLPQ